MLTFFEQLGEGEEAEENQRKKQKVFFS
jgi:hypothetical protein